ncbi:hypothetical protein TraAM80_08033, partial [Trypanosoma rangeli]
MPPSDSVHGIAFRQPIFPHIVHPRLTQNTVNGIRHRRHQSARLRGSLTHHVHAYRALNEKAKVSRPMCPKGLSDQTDDSHYRLPNRVWGNFPRTTSDPPPLPPLPPSLSPTPRKLMDISAGRPTHSPAFYVDTPAPIYRRQTAKPPQPA